MAYDESFAEALDDSTYSVDNYDESYDTDSSDEAYDTDSSDEAYDEANRRRDYRRPAVATGRYNRPIRPYQGRATLNTPAGPASLKLPTDLVRKDELRAALAAISSDIKKNSQAVLKINANLNDLNKKDGKSTHALSKRLAETDRKINALQQQQLFSLLMPARIEEITMTEKDDAGTTRHTVGTVESVKVDNTNPLIMSILGGGMSGIGNGGMGGMSGLALALLFTQKETSINSNSGIGGMLLPMMALNMFNNQPK